MVQTVQISDVDADVPVVVHDSFSYSARSLTRPLCTTTGVMVQTVQFLDIVRLLGKVVDTPVVSNDRDHGPDSAVLDKVIDVPVAMQRHVPMVFEVVLTVQFLDKVIDVSVAVQ